MSFLLTQTPALSGNENSARLCVCRHVPESAPNILQASELLKAIFKESIAVLLMSGKQFDELLTH